MEESYITKSGWLCLDFTNTVDWRESSHPEDKLTDYPRLIEWCQKVGIVSPDEAGRLLEEYAKVPNKGDKIFQRAIDFREALYHILLDNVKHVTPKPSDLTVINKEVKDKLSHSKLIPMENGYTWTRDLGVGNQSFLLWPIVKSTVDLMTSDSLERVGHCADEKGCGWLFWDSSRNRSRRWCDMSDCGNRAKARRYYKKAAASVK